MSRLTRLTPADPRVFSLLDGGRVGWIFPGSGNHFVGMGRDLALTLPRVLRGIDGETDLLRSQLMPAWYGPWRTHWEDGWETAAAAALRDDPRRMIFGQVAHGVTVARALEAFGLRPDAAIGYSLGESAALFATRAWADRDLMFQRTMDSPLFVTELSGENTVAAAAWGGANDWWPAVLGRPAAEVGGVLADLGGDEATTARLLIVNAPNECVIGGRRADVERVASVLGVEPRPLEGVPTVHCEVMAPVAQRYRDLHLLPTVAPEGMQFYSGCWARPFKLTEASAADSIVANAMHGLDYPATIERAYADGVRVFVEAGPQGSCARMVGAILGDRPHVAVSACRKGRTGLRNLLEAVGACAEAGVPVDLSVLYGAKGGVPAAPFVESSRSVRVVLGAPTRPVPPCPSPLGERTPSPPMPLPVKAPPPRPAAPVVSQPGQPLAPAAAFLARPGFDAAPLQAVTAIASAHDVFLRLARASQTAQTAALRLQEDLLRAALGHSVSTAPVLAPDGVPRSLDRARCMEFAVGSLGAVLGPRFAAIDAYPTRVRLPDEPLMFVDRILTIEGEPGSLGAGRCVTEHDVLPGAWYLDGGRVPVCVSVEAGQADLFLSAFLGIDEQTKGLRVYRLLDAQVVFHRDLPAAGDVIRYDIHIDRFIKQGSTYLFFFRFEGWIGDTHLISMRDGCAGFFTPEQLASGRGLVDPSAELPERRRTDVAGAPTAPFVPLVTADVPQSLDSGAVTALRGGDLETAFGPAFAGLSLHHGLHLPGGRMSLIHRVATLDPHGGAFGLGTVSTEWDVDPNGWFLTCHFIDDQVMPGTFMYEGCLHTLRVLLLRMGWIAPESDLDLHYAPIPGIPSRLRCRGQVTSDTRSLVYRLDIKEIGYDPEPYVLADALMYGDGRAIVQFENVSYRLSGITRGDIESQWLSGSRESPTHADLGPIDGSPFGPPASGKTPLYDSASILAYAVGKPSEAFGEEYLPFDTERRIARLPGPPLCFVDRVTEVEPAPWVLEPSGWIEAEYDVPPDAWYFAANRQTSMPFAILLETALQPCGWLAGYLGSALRSEQDLKFRNLSGTATLHGEIFADVGTLTTRVRLTGFSEAASMILQEFDFQLWGGGRILYEGVTRFGFFPQKALDDQVGLRGAAARAWTPDRELKPQAVVSIPPLRPQDVEPGERPTESGLLLPARAISMLDNVSYHPDGGAAGLGWIQGSKAVVADDWFFAAHFFEDPVIPGSLGLEAFLQLLKIVAVERFGEKVATHRFEPIGLGRKHTWLYRGQVIPTDAVEAVEATITSIEDGESPVITADGFLRVDGRVIYEMLGFTLRLVPGSS
jgi:3-hydroxymyristoyl/3-hydroxydecanoyl-(acyl carrier protein) dehydratase/malonyl CoA-acyl carrier protein transacylase